MVTRSRHDTFKTNILSSCSHLSSCRLGTHLICPCQRQRARCRRPRPPLVLSCSKHFSFPPEATVQSPVWRWMIWLRFMQMSRSFFWNIMPTMRHFLVSHASGRVLKADLLLTPLVMVDSGNNAKAGPAVYLAAYSTMVDASLARAPQAELQAYWSRQGDKVNFSVQVKNLSGRTLSSGNGATVHAIVYQQEHLQLTDRFVVSAVANLRSAAWQTAPPRLTSCRPATLSG